jgi:3-phosphoshikimate 1-carboxyvinyltransferase
MNVRVTGGNRISGAITVPPSKAETHRALIASLLTKGECRVLNPSICDDTIATRRAVMALGANVVENEDGWVVCGPTSLRKPLGPIYCGESGATLRFMGPIVALAPGLTVLRMGQSLRRRPIKPIVESLHQLGVKSRFDENLGILVVEGGGIQGGRLTIPGNISSQFISGLLFALPLGLRDSEIKITSRLESKGYVDLTIQTLLKHQVKVSEGSSGYVVPGNQEYLPYNHVIQGDYSSAAFLLAAAIATGSTLHLKGLSVDSLQPDRAIIRVLQDMGAKVLVGHDWVEIRNASLSGIRISAAQIPDLVPVCAVLGCLASGVTEIVDASRLRLKESDRLMVLESELTRMGANVRSTNDSLYVRQSSLHGAEVDSHGDHRIVMALTIAALAARGTTKIHGADCVKKSYPGFFSDLVAIGAEIHVE